MLNRVKDAAHRLAITLLAAALAAAAVVLVSAAVGTPAAIAAISTTQVWPTAISPAGTQNITNVGASQTWTFGTTGVSATVVTTRTGGSGTGQVTGGATPLDIAGGGSQAGTDQFLQPTPASNSASDGWTILGGQTFTTVVTFNRPVYDPILHWDNLNLTTVTVGGTSTTGAPIAITTLAKNNVMTTSGNTIDTTLGGAANGGCENNDGSNPAGRCGSFQLTTTSGAITAYTFTAFDTPTPDGIAWSMSFPSAPLTKAFNPTTIPAGGTSHLTFNIANPNNPGQAAFSPLDFTDNLPSGLTLADGTETDNGSCGGPTVTDATGAALAAGATGVRATNISAVVGATCAITVDVTASTPGAYTNNTSNVSTTGANLVPNTSTTLTVTSASTACTLSTAYVVNGAQLEAAVMGGPGALTFSAVGGAAANNYNALAYNPANGLLYGVGGPSDTHLLVINPATGAVTDAGPTVPPLAANADWGTFDAAGDYLEGVSTTAAMNVINVSTLAVATTTLSAAPGSSDLTFGPGGFLWGMKSGANTVVRVNPTTGAVATFAGPAGLPAGTYGADFTYGNGNIGVDNNAGGLYQLAIATPAATPAFTLVSHQTTPATANNDGASCISAQPVDLAITKNGPSTYTSGAPITYTITVTNNGPGISSGYVVSDTLPTSLVSPTTTTPGCAIATGVLTCTEGQLAVGASSPATVNATAPAGLLPAGIINTATVTGNEADPVSPNNTASTTATATGPAFTCDPLAYLFQASGGVESWYTIDLATGQPTPKGTLPVGINAVGYNTLDNYFYGWGGGQLVRVDANGNFTQLGIPPGLVTTNAYDSGDFDNAGHLWIDYSGNPVHWAEIDLAPGSPTYGQVLGQGNTPIPNNLQGGGDWSWINGKLYLVDTQVAGAGAGDDYLVQFDPTTGTEANLGKLSFSNAIVGATYTDANGNLYASDNTTGNIYRINVTTVTSTFISKGPAASGNDGARCALATVPTTTITKAVNGRVQPTDQFTVSLKNSAGTTLTSKSTAGGDTADSTTNWPVTEGNTYTFGEVMVAGSPDALTAYTAVPTCTDTTTSTPITPGGTAQAWTLPVTTGDAYNCTITNTPVTPSFTVSKVASAPTIQMGQNLTYTVTVKNTGPIAFTAASPAKFTDDLSGVLDDATYNNDATGGATITGTTLSWSGALAVGAATTITYSVQVNDPDTGNMSLVNGVTPGTGGTCATATSCQTTVPLVTPAAFGCTSPGYLFQNPNGLSAPHTVTGIDLASGTPTPLGNVADDLNAVGYNTLDGYFYAWDATSQDVVRINADYSLTHVATGPGTPSTASIMGDFDNAGHLWIANAAGSTHQWAELDYAPGSPTYGDVLAHGTYTNPAGEAGNADWSWLGGTLYTVETVSANPAGPAHLVKFNPATGVMTDLGALGINSTAGFGATYTDGTYIYAEDNGTGEIYRIDVAAVTSLAVATGPASAGNDGARCPTAPIATLTITKAINARVQATDQFTVNLKNSGGATLTSKTTAGADPSDSTTNFPVTQGNTYTFGEVMATGSPDTIAAYIAVPSCMDTTTGTPITPGGTPQAWTVPITSGDAYSCTITNTPAAGAFTVSKVASASSIQMGQDLTYTVTVKNTGAVPFTVASPAKFTDDLGGVLDDATYNGDATGGAMITGTTLSWSGALAVGATVTVTYSVQVNDPDTGDMSLVNGVTPGTDGTCATSTSCQTIVPVVTPAPFTCSALGLLFQTNGSSHTVTGVNLATGKTSPAGTTPDAVNAVGFNTLDDYIYGWDTTTNQLVRINGNGSLTTLPKPTGAPGGYNVGDFDPAGHLWMTQSVVPGTSAPWVEIDLAPGSSTYGQVIDSGTTTIPNIANVSGDGADWSWINGDLYSVGIATAAGADAHLFEFNPATGVTSNKGALAAMPYSAAETGVGATYTDPAGDLFASENGTGNIYRVNVTSVTATFIAKGPAAAGNDGARCAIANIPTITVAKTVGGRVRPTDQFTVDLVDSTPTVLTSVTSTGSTGGPFTSTNWPVTEGDTYTITDAMAAGSPDPLSDYSPTITCTDTTTNTPASYGGTAPVWSLTVTANDAYLCTVNNAMQTVNLSVDKQSTPDPYVAGSPLTYTVTVTNAGPGRANGATVTDPLPSALVGHGFTWTCLSTPGSTCAASGSGNISDTVNVAVGGTLTYTVTGTVPLGTTGTLTNTATVTPPTGVIDTDCTPNCSSVNNNPTPVVNTTKSIFTVNGVPANAATPVAAGDVLVYHIVTTNTGGAPGSAALSDPVPANTTYTGTGEGWTSCSVGSVAGTTCTQSVPVPMGTSVTTNYTVTVVNPLPKGVTSIFNQVSSPSGCNACTTTNPTAASLDSVKTLLTDNGTAATPATMVNPGDVLVYQIVTTNSGGTTGTTTLQDPVPTNMTYSGTGQGWSCPTGSLVGTACNQTISVASLGSVTNLYTTAVVNPLPAGTTSVLNQVTSTGGSCSSCSPANPTGSILSTSKALISDNGKPADASTKVAAGDVLVYQITVTNSGGSAGSQPLHDPVPVNTTYAGPVVEGWTCPSGSVAGTTCDQTVSVGAGAVATANYTITIANPLPVNTTSISNTVTAPGSICNPTCAPTNPTAAVFSTGKALISDNGVPASSATNVAAGDVLVYQITVTNTGGSSGNQALSDPVPANTTYTGPVGEGWSCLSGSVAGTACTQTVLVGTGATAR